MDDLLASITATNATRISAASIREDKRAALVRGVPGLPKSEDYLISWKPPPSEEVVRAAVAANPTRRGFRADPGCRELERAKFLRPKVLNSWVAMRAVQPARSYKTYIGKNKGDKRELYRWHSQPCEIGIDVHTPMMKQHTEWLEHHADEREKHMFPIFFYRKQLDEARKREDAELMKSGNKNLLTDASSPTEDLQSEEVSRSKRKVPVAPLLEPDIELDPPRFNYVKRIGQMIGLSTPWQLADEMRKSKK